MATSISTVCLPATGSWRCRPDHAGEPTTLKNVAVPSWSDSAHSWTVTSGKWPRRCSAKSGSGSTARWAPSGAASTNHAVISPAWAPTSTAASLGPSSRVMISCIAAVSRRMRERQARSRLTSDGSEAGEALELRRQRAPGGGSAVIGQSRERIVSPRFRSRERVRCVAAPMRVSRSTSMNAVAPHTVSSSSSKKCSSRSVGLRPQRSEW